VIFPDDYLRNKDQVREENICFVKGTVDRTREEPGLIVTRILTSEQAEREYTRGLMLKLHGRTHGEEVVTAVGKILQRAPGRCPVYLEITDAAGKRAWLRVGEQYYIDVGRLARRELEDLLGGPEHLEFRGPTNGNGRNGK
jgi:DNA polymerase-3 subunit alpha